MIYTLVNAFIFVVYALCQGKKFGFFSPAFFLTAIYAFIALMGVAFLPDYEFSDRIVFWPYIYLFIICFIFFRPVLNCSPSLEVTVFKTHKYIIFFYIVFAVINIHQVLLLLITWLQSGDWLALKAAAYGGDLGIQSNPIQVLASFYVPAFMPAMLVYAFYSLSKENIHFFKSLLLLLLAIIPDILVSLLYAYRGGLFTISLTSLSVYAFFRRKMEKNRQKQCDKVLWASGIAILLLVGSISFSRFGDEEAGNSIVSYVGQPMLVFNGGIAATANSTMGGKYFFQHLYKTNRDAIWNDRVLNIKTDNGGALNTFVGCSYLDFGPILTFIIAILVCVTLNHLLSRKKYHSFSSLYLYIFYLNYLFLGVFHSTIGYGRNVMLALLVFLLLRFIENNSKIYNKNGNKNYSMLS